MLWLVLASILTALSYFVLFKSSSHWKERRIPYLKPWPIFGNVGATIFKKCAFGDLLNDMYRTFPNERYFGIYQFFQPTLVIRDPDLIKKITVEEFDSFPDHQTFSSHFDPLWSRSLFSLHSSGIDGWKDMRTTLTPFFTCSNLKIMFPLIEDCAQQFTNYFQNQENADIIKVEVRDAFTRFTNDVIASTAFGITCNSLKDRENEFYMMGKDVTDLSGLRQLKFYGYSISPTLMKLLKVNLFSREATTFFRRLSKETMKMREEKQTIRSDMFHLLIEARKSRLNNKTENNFKNLDFPVVQELEENQENQEVELNDDDIMVQAFLFFLESFYTNSTLMCYTAYELALNPEVQKKLLEEIETITKEYGGKITYEAIQRMKYLDNVFSESLRKWPPAVYTDRKSVKPFTIDPEKPTETPLCLEAGTVCWIPIYALHRDPNCYLDPEKFDPDRFSDENRHKIKPFTYLPFGAGPRNCIALKFALLESKLIVVELLRKFEIVSISKTQIPLELNKNCFTSLPDEGVWLGLKKRM